MFSLDFSFQLTLPPVAFSLLSFLSSAGLIPAIPTSLRATTDHLHSDTVPCGCSRRTVKGKISYCKINRMRLISINFSGLVLKSYSRNLSYTRFTALHKHHVLTLIIAPLVASLCRWPLCGAGQSTQSASQCIHKLLNTHMHTLIHDADHTDTGPRTLRCEHKQTSWLGH